MDKMLNGSPEEITVDVNGEYRVRRPFRKVLRTLKEVDNNKNIFSYKEVSYCFTVNQMQEAIIPATDSRSIFSVIFFVLMDSSIVLEITTYAESAVAAFHPLLDIQ